MSVQCYSPQSTITLGSLAIRLLREFIRGTVAGRAERLPNTATVNHLPESHKQSKTKPCAMCGGYFQYFANQARFCASCLLVRSKDSGNRWWAKNRWRKPDPERRRLWLVANRDKQAERCRQWRLQYPEKQKASSKKWRLANFQKDRNNNKLWRSNNPANVIAWRKKWFATHPERAKEMARRAGHMRRTRELGTSGKLSFGISERLIKLQKGRCYWCKTSLDKSGKHLDHIIALAKGGRNDDSNVCLSCPKCNLSKSVKDPIVFMQERGYLL